MAKKRPIAVRPASDRQRPPGKARPKNRLLASLPAKDYGRLAPHLKTIPIRFKQVLHQPGDKIDAVYFLNGGVASITTVMSDGTMVEAATVGDEGMVGIEAFFGTHAVAHGETLIQVPDTDAEMMSVADFRREIHHGGAFQQLMGRYAHTVTAQMMQSTACNALHDVH
jgi:hypothetical protein